MNALSRLPLALILAATGVWFWFELADPYRHAAAGIGILLGFLLIATPARKSVLRFGSLAWNENELCRHILITGDTGCGKTSSGFHSILVQLTKAIPNWGGLVLGVKGDEHAFLAELMAANGRASHVEHLQVRPHGAGNEWIPQQRYNLCWWLQGSSPQNADVYFYYFIPRPFFLHLPGRLPCPYCPKIQIVHISCCIPKIRTPDLEFVD
ncbi:MAG: hypothetical protein KDN22_33940 [Verrucomicrobiae bacterium]|nr:hypothetical protein [Verrucomicrobiae bacterium]